mgnify:CR=1 FL=1
MARPLWFVNLIKKTFPNIKLIAKLTKVPVIGKILDNLLFEGDDIIYLPLDKVVPVNQTVEKEDMVLPSQVAEYFVKKAKHHWIMNFCICRDSMDCQDYPQELGCMFMGEAAEGINPELGRKVTKEEALEHLKKCEEAGLVHMIGRNKLDKQWLGVNPGNKLLTICNCCPCCCLWRIAPVLSPQIGSKVVKMPGVQVKVTDKCIGCGTCQDVCFVKAISIIDKRAVISDQCRGCGRCVNVCPQQAIELNINDPHFVRRSIERIDKLVDLT